MTESGKAKPKSVQAVDTGMAILRAIEAAGVPIALKDISAATGVDPGGTHRYLVSFVTAGLVRQADDAKYELGPYALQLGLSALQRAQPIKLIRATLPEIVRRTGWTTLLSVWSGQGPTIVDWERSHIPLVTALGLGSVLSVATSAQGRMFAAFLPRDLTAGLIAGELARNGIDPVAFEAELDRARRERLAYSDGTVVPGLAAVSSIVRDHRNEAIGAVTLMGADPVLATPDNRAALELRAFCDRLSDDLGATPRPGGAAPATGRSG